MGSNIGGFDVIGVTELFSMAEGQCLLTGYHPLVFATRNNSNSSKGGVGVYIKDTLKYKMRHDLCIFIPNIFESIFIEINLGHKKLIIGTVYRPNSYPNADIDIFMQTMNDLQQLLAAENKETYLMGDMNIDLLKCSNHLKTGEYLESVFSHGFLPLITKPTRITDHSATLIDHIYANKLDILSTSGIIINDISDHFGVFAIIKRKIYDKIKQHETLTRSFSPKNIDYFNNLLTSTDFETVFKAKCPDMAYNAFMDHYMKAYDTAFPLKHVKIPKRYVKRLPWMTKGLIKSSTSKAKLLKKKLRKPTDHNINKYKTFCSIYNKLSRSSKATYFQEQIQLAKYNVKKTWSILRTAINQHNNQVPLPDHFKHNNNTLKDKRQIVERFNNFFSNIGYDISENVPLSQHSFSHYLQNKNPKSIFLDPVTPGDVIDVTSKIKSKRSLDHNNISSNLMKASIQNTAVPLTHIINLSLATGVVPQNMKIAKVIPIFKSGDRTLFTNYRPISILPVYSKILERIISKKLITFLNMSNQLYEHQYGFRPGHSTIHPIIQLLNQIAQENDKAKKHVTMSVFLDLSKAFDTISHDILIKKMENMGIRGVAQLWFKSYLSDRKQFMEFSNTKSSFENIKCGVPQGSILGPILFLIYINDIKNSSKLSILCFADDTTVSYSSQNIPDLHNVMHAELEKLNQWFRANKLCLNTQKTKYIIFRPQIAQTMDYERSLKINEQNIERIGNNLNTKSFKFLGIHIDETTSWKFHIDHICKKISSANYIIKKAKNFLPISCLMTLYQSLIQCHINYGLEAWGSSSSIERLYKLQKRSIRTINQKSYNYHTEPLFKKCNILTVRDQYKLNVSTFMHRYKDNKLPKSFMYLGYFTPSLRQTRQRNTANQKRARTKYSSLLPYHNFPKLWNNLAVVYTAPLIVSRYSRENSASTS
jgi:hypothetical protein